MSARTILLAPASAAPAFSATVYSTPSTVTFSSFAAAAKDPFASATVEPIEYSLPAIVTLSPAFRSSITNVAVFALSVNVPFKPAS